MTVCERTCVISVFAAVVIGGTAFSDETNTTINTVNKWAWSAGAGWINCRPDITNGASIGEFICSGYFYSSTAGWIHLGDGSPSNGLHYSNGNSVDYGVNHDGEGNLRGYAWCEGSGWINFEWTNKEHADSPKVDLKTGNFSGHAWGDTLGWICLTNLSAYVQTENFKQGTDSNTNGLPDDWEISEAGSTDVLAGGTNDWDEDGVSDYNEYIAGTSPTNRNDYLCMTGVSPTNGTNMVIVWMSKPTRLYDVDKRTNLLNGTWSTYQRISVTGNTGYITLPVAGETQAFYRVKAVLPLSD